MHHHFSTYTTRYRQLAEQRAYRRRVAALGLPALLAPYTMRRPFVPVQRRTGDARSVIV